MSVRIYVEGGGNQASTLAGCRRGFSRFFEKVVQKGKQPKVIACGSRDEAFHDFCTALKNHADSTVALLIDSESPISNIKCWEHLANRDKWQKPKAANDNSVYLMVQTMEAWFFADKKALADFYGQGFLANSLPNSANVESIDKAQIENLLDHATRNTQKGRYHKTQHGFEISLL